MILPSKYTHAEDSLIGQSATILAFRRGTTSTVSDEWVTFSRQFPDTPFDRFLEALTLLFMVGVVDFRSGLLSWSR